MNFKYNVRYIPPSDVAMTVCARPQLSAKNSRPVEGAGGRRIGAGSRTSSMPDGSDSVLSSAFSASDSRRSLTDSGWDWDCCGSTVSVARWYPNCDSVFKPQPKNSKFPINGKETIKETII